MGREFEDLLGSGAKSGCESGGSGDSVKQAQDREARVARCAEVDDCGGEAVHETTERADRRAITVWGDPADSGEVET